MNKISEIELHYKSNGEEEIKITSSLSAYELFLEYWDKNTIELQEEFKVLLLSRSNTVLGIYNLSKGGIAGTVVDVKLLFAVAIKSKASGFILAHNHPSGNLKPSINDINLTKKIREASKYLDIELIDHIIVSNKSYCSFIDLKL